MRMCIAEVSAQEQWLVSKSKKPHVVWFFALHSTVTSEHWLYHLIEPRSMEHRFLKIALRANYQRVYEKHTHLWSDFQNLLVTAKRYSVSNISSLLVRLYAAHFDQTFVKFGGLHHCSCYGHTNVY